MLRPDWNASRLEMSSSAWMRAISRVVRSTPGCQKPPYRISNAGPGSRSSRATNCADELSAWFVAQVLPLEGVLERYLRRNWRDVDGIADLRQEVYACVYDACADTRPDSAQAFVLSTARNPLIDRARRAQIVSIETFADMDSLAPTIDELSPERYLAARSELRLLQVALNLLPARCREVIEMRKIEGLSHREVAIRMGITEDTVERHVSIGVRALAAALQATGLGSGIPSARRPQRKGQVRLAERIDRAPRGLPGPAACVAARRSWAPSSRSTGRAISCASPSWKAECRWTPTTSTPRY